jgi:hypothetical protein
MVEAFSNIVVFCAMIAGILWWLNATVEGRAARRHRKELEERLQAAGPEEVVDLSTHWKKPDSSQP